MAASPSSEITQLLERVESGEAGARDALFDAAYQELRDVAAGLMQSQAAHTLQATALVNEAVLRILGGEGFPSAKGRAYFFGAMCRAMRRVLVDHARKRNAQRRGGTYQRQALDDTVAQIEETSGVDLLALEEALERLAALNPRQADVVTLRFFGGLAIDEVAADLGVSPRTIDNDWRLARAWLKQSLESSHDGID